jgi:very-short-patch-repair endonuclease
MIFQRRVIEAKQSHGASLAIKARAKSLRLNMTETEKILWSKIRNKQQN